MCGRNPRRKDIFQHASAAGKPCLRSPAASPRCRDARAFTSYSGSLGTIPKRFRKSPMDRTCDPRTALGKTPPARSWSSATSMMRRPRPRARARGNHRDAPDLGLVRARSAACAPQRPVAVLGQQVQAGVIPRHPIPRPRDYPCSSPYEDRASHAKQRRAGGLGPGRPIIIGVVLPSKGGRKASNNAASAGRPLARLVA